MTSTPYKSALSCLRLFALLALTGTAAAGAASSITCSYSSATANPVRIEGKTEQVGDYLMTCSNTGPSPVILSFKATMSQPVTSKAIGTSGQSEAAVIVQDSAGVQPTTATPGTVSGMQVNLTATIPPNTNTSSSYLVDITNVRIDPTALGVGGTATEQVLVYQGVTQLNNFSAQSVAVGVQGLGSQTLSGISSPPACFSYTAAAPLFTVNFGEGASAPTAFKTQGGSGNSSIGSSLSNNTETGYYISSGGYNNQANSGTRVRILFTGLPNNVSLYVPVALQNSTSGGTLTATASESGAYSQLTAAGSPSGYTGSAALAQIAITNGSAEVVYEVTAQSTRYVETYSAPVYVVSTGTVSGAGSIGATVSFAPVGASSNVPNFVQASSTTPLTASNCVTITSTAAANAVQNYAYSQNLSASGGQIPYIWSLYSGNPPAGIGVNSAGTLSGTPTASPGSYPFVVQVQDANSVMALQSLTITVNPAVSITTAALPNAALTELYSATLSAAYGNGGPYTWALVNGSSLPAGLTLSAGGVISGTPTTTGTYSFSVMATDTASGASAFKLLSAIVNPALSITTTSFPAAGVGVSYPNAGAAASGGSAGNTWSLTSGSSALTAAGLSFSAQGVLSGTPTSSGSIALGLKVTDQGGGSATKSVILTVYPAIAISNSSLVNGTAGMAYSLSLTATGGSGTSANYSWSATGLPSFLTLSAMGVLSGTPASGGSYSGIAITVTDTLTTQAATATFSLTVIGPITFNYLSAAEGTGPLGYYRLESTSGNSEVGGSTYSSTGATVQGGAPIGVTPNQSLSLNGTTGAITTTLSGGINNAATIVAWVNLNTLPSAASNSIQYVAGESQVGNDLDLQFTNDNYIRFYTTASGQNIAYAPPTANLVGQWHMVAATFANTGNSGARAIYWDGVQVATDTTVSYSGKSSAFNIGATPVFPGRNFPGAIDEVGIWATALSAAQIAEMYASTSGSLPAGLSGSNYSPVTLYALGGSGSFTWSATGLPAGLTLSSGGLLSGVPTTAGTSNPVITILDTNTSASISPTVQIVVNPQVSIQTTALATATLGTPYSFSIAASGGVAPYTFTVTSGSLPAGLTLNAATGAVSGTPTAAGSGSFGLQVMDSSGGSATQTIAYTVGGLLTITTSSLTAGVVNDAYSQTLMATNNTGSVTWTLISGSLPAGVTLSAAGAISGTPTVSGSFSFVVMASDSSPIPATQALTLRVNAALTISTITPPAGAVGETYSASLSASGGLGSDTWSVLSGSLPGGVTLSAGGVLSGTPTVAGAFTFTAKAADQNSDTASASVTVTIKGALTVTTTAVSAATAGIAYTQTLAASGGVGSYSWSATGLPSTITCSTAGTCSGTPTSAGSYLVVLTVTDGNAKTAMQAVTLTVNAGALSVTTQTLASAVNGTAYSATLAATGGTPPYTWSVSAGTVAAAGLTVSSAGAVTGTPNITGTLSFTVQVADSNSMTAQASLALAIAPSTPPTYDFAVSNSGGSIVRVSDLVTRDATICANCTSNDLTADAQGNIYSRNTTGIVKVTPSGTSTTVLNFSATNSALASGAGVGGIALDGLGNIIFVDNNADAVFRVKTDGTGFTQVAPFPILSPNEAQDTYVAVDSSGNYIVGDDGGSGISVWKFTPTGTTGTSVLSGAITGSELSGLAIDPNGNYDILDYVNNRIVSVTPQGGVSALFSTAAQTCCRMLGLTIEKGTSNLIFGVSGANVLARVTPAGAATYIAYSGLISRPSTVVSIPAASLGPLTLSPSSLPSGNSGQTYGPISLAASGGSGSYTWTGTGFPSGIGISSAGVINGSTSQTGYFSIRVTATDTVTAQTGTASYSVSFTNPIPPITITQTAGQLSTALGGSVSASFSASGGIPPYTFAASGLPGGVSINSSTGAISGTPAQAGNFSVGVQVSDQQPRVAGFSLTISVLGLSSGSLPAGVAGQSYSGSVGAVGGSGTYTFTATGLPAGLALNSSSGAIVGMVKTAGTYTFTVKVTDSGGLTISGSFSITIAPPPALKITSSSLPGGNVGVSYGQGLTATGGFPPYTWAQSGGSLPAGMSFSSSGVVSGTPTAPGSYSFGAMATDASGGVTTASVSLAIQPAALTITTSPALPSGIAGFDYPMQVFTATGGTGAYTWSLSSGSLPAGLTFSGGVLSGNTGAAGTYALGVTVTDAASAKATASYSLTIRPAGAADLLISSGSIGFTVSTPSTSGPPGQSISVQSSQAGTPLSYSLSVSPAASWLSVQNGSSTPDEIQASLTASALTMAAGSYSTTLTLTCTSTACAGHTQTVGVSLTVNSAPAALSVGTSLISFGLSTASPVPASQTISLANAGGGSLLFGSVGCEASWCTVSGVPGNLTGGQSGSITVTVDPNAAGPGFSRTQVDIVTSGGKASVPVNALVATNPTMTLAPVGQQFGMPAGSGPGNPNGSFLVTVANGSSVSWSASVVSSNTPWLVLGTASGTSTPSQPGSVTYSIGGAAAMLAPGAYYGQIQVTSSGVVDSPQVFEVVLNVTAATAPSAPDAEPGGLLFITTAAATPPPQTVTVYTGSPSALTFQASVTPASVASWLSVTPATGQTSQTAPGSVLVTVNPAKLTPGIYTAGVSFSLSAAAVRTVNVTVIVTPPSGSVVVSQNGADAVSSRAATCTASTLAPTQTGLVNNFSAPVAWPTPLSIVLADNCGSLLTTGQIVATFSNGDPPLALTLSNPSAGSYSATWTPRSSSAQMSITAHASAPGYPATTAQIVGATVPNAAPLLTPHGTLHSFAPVVGAALAPGTIVQIYGQNLAGGVSQPTSIPLPTTSGGTSVIIGGIPAPLYYVSAGQINAQIPFELTPLQPYQVIVSANGALTTPDTVNLTPATPGFAAFGDGTLIAQHGDGSLVSATSPARSGEYLVAYLAGMGTTNATPASGAASPSSPLALPTVSPTLTINGANSPIAFAGLTPGLVGLYQMNFQAPAGLPTGDITIVVSQAGVPTNQTVLPYTP